MLRLSAPNDKQQEACVPVRWCVSKDVLETLEKDNVKEPLLFISITHNKREVDRVLVPLEQMMEYIQLRHAGINTLHAFIVWSDYESSDRMVNRFLSRRAEETFSNYLYD